MRATRTKKYGEDAPETADLYFSYGKALLENAISQASVLGKDQQPKNGEDAEEQRMWRVRFAPALPRLIME